MHLTKARDTVLTKARDTVGKGNIWLWLSAIIFDASSSGRSETNLRKKLPCSLSKIIWEIDLIALKEYDSSYTDAIEVFLNKILREWFYVWNSHRKLQSIQAEIRKIRIEKNRLQKMRLRNHIKIFSSLQNLLRPFKNRTTNEEAQQTAQYFTWCCLTFHCIFLQFNENFNEKFDQTVPSIFKSYFYYVMSLCNGTTYTKCSWQKVYYFEVEFFWRFQRLLIFLRMSPSHWESFCRSY